MVVDRQSGKLLIDKPWFIIFVKEGDDYCEMMKESMDNLAKHYDGEI